MENCILGVLRVDDLTVGDDFLHLFPSKFYINMYESVNGYGVMTG